MRIAVLALAAVLAADAACAGAWTQDRGHYQVISGATTSMASRAFGDGGAPDAGVKFSKTLMQNWLEYGLTDAVTLFAAPEYVIANSDTGNGLVRARSASVEGGVRILLLSRIGMLSVQGSARTAGAFAMNTSASGAAGRQFELRLLYGRSFKLFSRDGFIDIEAGQRWIKRPRPDETVVDATAGLWLRRRTLLMVQSFNTVSGNSAKPPYLPYRLHKVEASLVERVTRHWSLQVGGVLSLAGRNVVKERGLVAAVWYQY